MCMCVEVCVCVCVEVCVNVCSLIAKILEKNTYMESNISSQMAQVQFFSSLTLAFIFKIKVVAFFLFCENLANGERQSKHRYCHQTRSHALAIEWRHCECCTSRSWPTFSRTRIINCEYLAISTDLAKGWRYSQNSNRLSIRCAGDNENLSSFPKILIPL